MKKQILNPCLNLLKPDNAFLLKWLPKCELANLETLVLAMTPEQYRLLTDGWGLNDGNK